MIPELVDGVLPDGIHECTIAEVENAFGNFQSTDRRPRLTEKLKEYLAEAKLSGTATAVVIDGSYVTGKPDPGDIDLILVLRGDFDLTAELSPLEYNVQSRGRARRLYGFDVRAAAEGSDALAEYIDFFSKVRSDAPGRQPRKGLLRVSL
ncbi:MAG TPA: hypothetical protein VJX67_12840 [Blastocatellia bacterium]|nr:hypothetical protein [Blastocatellia bacterium]